MPTVSTRAGELAYEETGKGEPLVLLHAILHDRHDLYPITPRLTDSAGTLL